MFTHSNETLVWRHVRHARVDLVEYLRTLSPEDWDSPSLCEGWLVRDVVAHLILEYYYSPTESFMDFVRSRFRVNVFMRDTAIRLGRTPTRELLQSFESMIDKQQKPASVSVINVLADLLVHEQDIRVPLRRPKDIPLESLKLIFSHWEPMDFNFGEKITGIAKRVEGLQFIATDIGITKGKGAVVEGNAQDILLAITGRVVSLKRLNGDGVAVLSNYRSANYQ